MLKDLLERVDERREHDAKRWEERDGDLCMLCHAHGADKRSLFLSCFYDVSEVVPEAIDLKGCDESVNDRGWYLRICKSCRGALLQRLQGWRNERVALRSLPKDHDGYILEVEEEGNIPVRIHGATVMMTEEEYRNYKLASV